MLFFAVKASPRNAGGHEEVSEAFRALGVELTFQLLDLVTILRPSVCDIWMPILYIEKNLDGHRPFGWPTH